MVSAAEVVARHVARRRDLWVRALWTLFVLQLIALTSFVILVIVGVVQVDNDRMVSYAFLETLQIVLVVLMYMTASRRGVLDRRSLLLVLVVAILAFFCDLVSFLVRVFNVAICPDDTRFQSADDCDELYGVNVALTVIVGILALIDISEFVVLAWTYASESAAAELGPDVEREATKRRGRAQYSVVSGGSSSPYVNGVALRRDLVDAVHNPRRDWLIAVFKTFAWWDLFVTAIYFISWAMSYTVVQQNDALFLIGILSVWHAGYSVAMLWREPIYYSRAAALLAGVFSVIMFCSDLVNGILRMAALLSCRSSATDPFIMSLQNCSDSGIIAIEIVLVVLISLFLINDIAFAVISGFLFTTYDLNLAIAQPTTTTGGGGGGGGVGVGYMAP